MPIEIPRLQTPHTPATPILTGHYYGEASYNSWRPYGTVDWLLMYTVSGRGRVGVADGPDQIALPGDVVLLRPGTLHDYGTARGPEAGWEILWVHFLPRPHWQDWLATWPNAAPGLVRIPLGEPERAETERCLRAMHRHSTGGQSQRDAFAMNALEEALLWCDRSLFPYGVAGAGRLDDRILHARTYLLEHLSEPVPLPTLAREVGLSLSRLAHLFREQTGQTPQQFVEGERMARARQLLERTTRSIASIAGDVGYENAFYFSLRFRKHMGLSPRDWRQQRMAEDAARRGVPPPTEDGSV